MPRCAAALSLLLPLLAGCLADTPERARIVEVQVSGEGAARQLELTQELVFSPRMRAALEHGIPLRLTYRVHGCGIDWLLGVELRYSPLNRRFELLRPGDPQPRSFARSGALLDSLDRMRLPLGDLPPGCTGEVKLGLDLTTLPTPLRFPAFLKPGDWRMVSPPATWSIPRPAA